MVGIAPVWRKVANDATIARPGKSGGAGQGLFSGISSEIKAPGYETMRLTPFDYLKDMFTRLPAAKINPIKEFTPAAWANAEAKENLVAQAA
jgi:hypothetical protein